MDGTTKREKIREIQQRKDQLARQVN